MDKKIMSVLYKSHQIRFFQDQFSIKKKTGASCRGVEFGELYWSQYLHTIRLINCLDKICSSLAVYYV